MLKSTVLKLANYLGDYGLFRLLCPGRIPVFMLHRISKVGWEPLPGGMTEELLRAHLNYLARHGYRVLSMDELRAMLYENRRPPSKSVMFTIDDGFFDQHDVAARIFEEFDFVLNFFVITGFLDGELWPWDDHIGYALHRAERTRTKVTLPSGALFPVDLVSNEVREVVHGLRARLKNEDQSNVYDWLSTEFYPALHVEFPVETPPAFRPMSWESARGLHDSGHGVFPHTCTHRILSALPLHEKRSEIAESIERVKAELDYLPDVFAYPTGRLSDYDMTDIEQLKKSGIEMAFNTVPEYVQAGQNYFELPRFSLPCNHDDFRQIVNRFEALKMRVRQLIKPSA